MEELEPILSGRRLEQINHSLTIRKGTVRGLHYQNPPHSEVKMVTCLRGRVFDVAVDLRRNSPTFLRWYGVELRADEPITLWVPEGCAHGFQSLEDHCELIYFNTRRYCPEAERGLHPEDPRLGIRWPMPIVELSTRDARFPFLTEEFEGVAL